jgi:hypothetical protein
LRPTKHARKVRDLRHRGDFFADTNSMKSILDIANPTALRPYRHGPAACALPRDERGHQGFIHNG